jgi:murein DD-endopeptidase MepM/ murein hydrolase activator NlpD
MNAKQIGTLSIIVVVLCFFAGCTGTSPGPDVQNRTVTVTTQTIMTTLTTDEAPVSTSSPASPVQSGKVKATTPQQSSQPGKFLIFYPWPKGELRDLTTGYHDSGALDFTAFGTQNAAVSAVANGTVLLSEFSHPDDFNTYRAGGTGSEFEDMGNFVIMRHGPATYTVYMHLRHEDPAPVTSGRDVRAGTRIGWQGNTGWSHGAHLHFAVVDVQIFPSPSFIEKPRESWGFKELNGSNTVILNTRYLSENALI